MIVYLSVLDTQEKKSKFEQLYMAYRKQMYYAAFRILQHDEDAEDAVHHATPDTGLSPMSTKMLMKQNHIPGQSDR